MHIDGGGDGNGPSYSGKRSCLTLFAISELRPQTTMGIGDMTMSALVFVVYSDGSRS